jgi:hypothetical protein
VDWSIPQISAEDRTGSLEFTVGGDDVGMFFPVAVSFVGQGSVAGIKVASAAKVDGSGDVTFSMESLVTAEEYHVV